MNPPGLILVSTHGPVKPGPWKLRQWRDAFAAVGFTHSSTHRSGVAGLAVFTRRDPSPMVVNLELAYVGGQVVVIDSPRNADAWFILRELGSAV